MRQAVFRVQAMFPFKEINKSLEAFGLSEKLYYPNTIDFTMDWDGPDLTGDQITKIAQAIKESCEEAGLEDVHAAFVKVQELEEAEE